MHPGDEHGPATLQAEYGLARACSTAAMTSSSGVCRSTRDRALPDDGLTLLRG